ncbi:MAG: AMP-binding protein [Sulfurimonas sp.]|nr:AMP-binding protein [Sulfurimonas sp.]
MILKYIHPDNSIEMLEFDFEVETSKNYKFISSSNKLEYIKKFLPLFVSGQKMVLFDANHKQLLEFHNQNDINLVDDIKNLDAQLLFFTSGSSGFPVGAFKSRDNLLSEIEVLKNLLLKYKIKRVVATVPFVHIYGVLAGLLLPLYLGDVELIVKDDFLPYELLEETSCGETLVITTPVFIKALSKLSDSVDLSSSLFISSTGPLESDAVFEFENKYQTTLMQLFGSTETGGIAYKFGSSTKWIPLQNVEVKSIDDKLSVSSPFISKNILDGGFKELNQPFITEDIIELDDDGFILLGRGNKIIKIAGKRISAIAIENLLESIPEIKKAIVELVYKKELLRSEQILITFQAQKEIKKSVIKDKINECYGVLTIPFSVKYVDKINLSAMGKKIIF